MNVINRNAPDFDIIVCGGGMVGATVAALLATDVTLKGLRIALIESQSSQPPGDEVDVRVSAISRASERILARCGAWPLIKSSQRCAYQDMVVWDYASPAPNLHSKHVHGELLSVRTGEPFNNLTRNPSASSGRTALSPEGLIARPEALHFSAASMAEPNLGYIIANNCIQWAALEAGAQTGVTRFATRLSSIKLDDVRACVQLDDGRSITAHLVIGADGARSVSRECVGIAANIKPYQQSALVTHIRTEWPHQFTAWQRFLSNGPIALLPLNDGRSSIVWTTTPDHADHLLKLNDVQLANEIGNACDHVLGQVTIAGARAAFPLQLAQVDEYCRARFVLVGDAAHSIHPLAGQGVNLGLMDAASLVQVLSEAREHGASMQALSEMRVLRRYERWRKTENTIALSMVDGINRLFSNDSTVLSKARRIGLQTVERHSLIKRFFMSRALGIGGDAPRMASHTS
ncbi:MAG TPA: UbiH/UbiF/VisC/COQ6 family ubiquinone biosynthesis hydroxylase [Steroidobacteraceae bacterium]|nr:UbiH/UbiF/VisC/COQ6 family ubiquinone biosynthesis hydroxylase [Steroidobacteraceae bacterium]